MTKKINVKTDSSRQGALARFLGLDRDELTEEQYDGYGMKVFSAGEGEYAIGTEEEASEALKENIKEMAWAFNASFLADFTDLPEEVFKAMQGQCEGSNDAVLKLIERSDNGFDGFVEEAESADGRGHFLSSYDGEENEEGEYFIYRIN